MNIMNIWRFWTPANKQTPIARPARGAGTHPIPRFSRMAQRPAATVGDGPAGREHY